MTPKQKLIYTIGHSTRTLEELLEILKKYEITQLVDIRTMPRSRYTPQFNLENLEQVLPRHDIKYIHLEKLGGLRSAKKDSTNGAWKNKSFRGFADYMESESFREGMDELVVLASTETCAIMCAEAVPWRCHRSMVGDALIVRGFEVLDIFNIHDTREEKLTPFAKVAGDDITYPKDSLVEDLREKDL